MLFGHPLGSSPALLPVHSESWRRTTLCPSAFFTCPKGTPQTPLPLIRICIVNSGCVDEGVCVCVGVCQPVPWPPALPFPSTLSQREVYVHHERGGLALPPWHSPPDQTNYMGGSRARKIHPNLCQACPRETLTYRLPPSERWNRPFPGAHTRISRKLCINKVLSSVEKRKKERKKECGPLS